MKRLEIMAFDPRKQKTIKVGYFLDGALIKNVTSAHFMKKEQGYGIQEEAIQKLIDYGCQTVFIITTSETYEIPFTEYLKNPPKDYGNGPQRFVKINRKYIPTKEIGQTTFL